MKKLILLLAGSLVFATPAMAHTRYPDHPNYGKPHKHYWKHYDTPIPPIFPRHNHCHYHKKRAYSHCHSHGHGGKGRGHHGFPYMHGFYYETEPAPWSIHFDF